LLCSNISIQTSHSPRLPRANTLRAELQRRGAAAVRGGEIRKVRFLFLFLREFRKRFGLYGGSL
jgi:hypothetical protein